ncbi:unnamed protein product [Natator depressus]
MGTVFFTAWGGKNYRASPVSKVEQLPKHSTENTPTEERIQCEDLFFPLTTCVWNAAISEFGPARLPRVKENKTSTYAVIGKVCGRPS